MVPEVRERAIEALQRLDRPNWIHRAHTIVDTPARPLSRLARQKFAADCKADGVVAVDFERGRKNGHTALASIQVQTGPVPASSAAAVLAYVCMCVW